MFLFDLWHPLSLSHWFKPFLTFGGGGEKEARRQEDVARQAEQRNQVMQQYLSQLNPNSPEYNELVTFATPLFRADDAEAENKIRQLGTQLVSQFNTRVGSGGAGGAFEERTNLAFQGLRNAAAFSPEEEALLNALRGITGAPGAEGEATQDIFSQLVRRAQDPNAAFTSTFTPQLQLLQDQVKARAAQRGVLGSGLELEDLGRTGVELAIREASAREQFRQQQLQNFQSLFNAGQDLRGREIGVEEALLNLQQGRESRLTDILNANTFNRGSDFASLLQRQTGRSEDLLGQAQEADAARKQQIGQIIGTGLAIGAAPFTGGASLAFIPAAGQVGGDVAGLLGGTRTAPTTGTTPDLATTLSRTSGTGSMDADTFAKLLRSLNDAGVR